jgi:hypothetical protein
MEISDRLHAQAALPRLKNPRYGEGLLYVNCPTSLYAGCSGIVAEQYAGKYLVRNCSGIEGLNRTLGYPAFRNSDRTPPPDCEL